MTQNGVRLQNGVGVQNGVGGRAGQVESRGVAGAVYTDSWNDFPTVPAPEALSVGLLERDVGRRGSFPQVRDGEGSGWRVPVA